MSCSAPVGRNIAPLLLVFEAHWLGRCDAIGQYKFSRLSVAFTCFCFHMLLASLSVQDMLRIGYLYARVIAVLHVDLGMNLENCYLL